MKHLRFFMSVVITDLIIKTAKKKCKGCVDGKKLAMNHSCEQMSLLDKFIQYYDQVVTKLEDPENLNAVISRFVTLFPGYTKDTSYSVALSLLMISTPRSIYYAGYCDDEGQFESVIDELVNATSGKDGIESIMKSPKRAAEKTQENVPILAR